MDAEKTHSDDDFDIWLRCRYEFGTSYVLREYKTLYEDGNIDIN